jgi:hypothetical protein
VIWVTNFTLQGESPLLILIDPLDAFTLKDLNIELNKGFGIPLCHTITFAAIFSSEYPPNDTAFVLRGEQSLQRVLESLWLTQGTLLKDISLEQVWPVQITLPSKEDETSISDPVAVKLVRTLRRNTFLADDARYTLTLKKLSKRKCWDMPVFNGNFEGERIKGQMLNMDSPVVASPEHFDILLRLLARGEKHLEPKWLKMKEKALHIQAQNIVELPIACPLESMEEQKQKFFKVFATRRGSASEDDAESEEEKVSEAKEQKSRAALLNCAADTYEKLHEPFHWKDIDLTARDVNRNYLAVASVFPYEEHKVQLQLALGAVMIEMNLKRDQKYEDVLKRQQKKNARLNDAKRDLSQSWVRQLHAFPASMSMTQRQVAILENL